MKRIEKLYRYQLVWGVVGVLAAGFGLFHSRGLPFTAAHGAETGLPHYELHWMTYNRAGALIALSFAVIGLVGGATRRATLGWVAAAGFAFVSLQTLVQWRDGAGSNVFGSTGPTMAFSVAMVLIFAVTAAIAGPLRSAADQRG
jgi:hypothetical protein